MDANYFFSAIIALISIITPVIMKIYELYRNSKQNRLLELHVKYESQTFYGGVMFIDFCIVVCESIICNLFLLVFKLLFSILNIQILLVYIKTIIAILMLVCYIISVKIVKECAYVRKRILGYRMAKWLLYIPLVIMNLQLYFNRIIITSIYIAELIGLIGLIYFPSRYKSYEYSSVRIYTNSNEIIDCKDISLITKKHDAVVIMNEGIENRIKYDCIVRVKYYGGPKVIMRESWFI